MSDLQQLKEQAIAYYQENKVPLRMQDVLNVMFQTNPPDVNGYVSTYFEKLAHTPTITKSLAFKSMDCKGQPAILTKLYGLIRNTESLVGESRVCMDTQLMDNAKIEDKETEEESREREVEEAIKLINDDFQDLIISSDPRHQQELDDKIYQFIETRRLEAKQQEEKLREAEIASPQTAIDDMKKGGKKSGKGSGKKKAAQVQIVPDRVKEKSYPGCTAVTALSQVLCVASASLNHTTVFDHLLSCYGGDHQLITLPLPVMTLVQSGKAALGKCNCIKEYMIVPRVDMPVEEAITAAAKFHDAVIKSTYAKVGIAAKNLSDFGTVCPVIDKPEQGLDMVIDVVTQQGFEMGKDFFFILNASAHEFFDYEKGKYEVITGMAKSSDDMADFWTDLSNRYPAIIGIIDPIRGEEMPQWNKICSSISDHCLIIADKAYDRPGLLKEQELNFFEFATSGVLMRLDGCTTVTQIVQCSKKMADMSNTVMLSGGQHETNDTTLVDIAIASKARFIKLGAPSRGERIAQYNRLVEIERELGDRKAEWTPLEFPVIPPKPPTPTPEPEEPSAQTEE